MDKSPKNRLQERIAKERNNPPKYENIIEGVQGFKSKVEFFFRDRSYFAVSDVFSSKKAAQSDAAEKGLAQIADVDNDKYSKSIKNKNIKIFVDYENYQDDEQIDLFKQQQPDIEVIKCVSTKHPKLINADKWVDCDKTDATDIFIVCQVAVLKEVTNKEAILFVITRDKFASVLECIYKNVYNEVSIENAYRKIVEIV